MQLVAADRTSTCAVTTAITQDSSKQNEELVETKSAKALLIMPTTVTTALHEQRQKSDTFNGHAALIKNITKFGLQVCINVPLDGNCLFTAVCDHQLMRVLGECKRHLSLRKEVVNYTKCNPLTVSFRMAT